MLTTTSLPPLPHLGATDTALFCPIESPESLPLHTGRSSATRPLDKPCSERAPCTWRPMCHRGGMQICERWAFAASSLSYLHYCAPCLLPEQDQMIGLDRNIFTSISGIRTFRQPCRRRCLGLAPFLPSLTGMDRSLAFTYLPWMILPVQHRLLLIGMRPIRGKITTWSQHTVLQCNPTVCSSSAFTNFKLLSRFLYLPLVTA